MANHQSLPHHGNPSPALSLMLKEFTERNLRRLFCSYAYPFSVLTRDPCRPTDPLHRRGTRAVVNCTCPRSSQPSTSSHVRMNTRVLGGGTPNFLMYSRVMSLQ